MRISLTLLGKSASKNSVKGQRDRENGTEKVEDKNHNPTFN